MMAGRYDSLVKAHHVFADSTLRREYIDTGDHAKFIQSQVQTPLTLNDPRDVNEHLTKSSRVAGK